MLRSKKGFTFLELVIAIALLCILIAIGIPYFRTNNANAQLRVSASELVTDLELTKSYAKAGGTTAVFNYKTPANASTGYSVQDTAGDVKKTVEYKDGITADYSGLSQSSLGFNGNGSCTASGDIILRSENTKKTFTISITQVTGMVKNQEN